MRQIEQNLAGGRSFDQETQQPKLVLFILPPIALWLDWIKDESSIAITDEEKKRVLELYEKATVDYLCMFFFLYFFFNFLMAFRTCNGRLEIGNRLCHQRTGFSLTTRITFTRSNYYLEVIRGLCD